MPDQGAIAAHQCQDQGARHGLVRSRRFFVVRQVAVDLINDGLMGIFKEIFDQLPAVGLPGVACGQGGQPFGQGSSLTLGQFAHSEAGLSAGPQGGGRDAIGHGQQGHARHVGEDDERVFVLMAAFVAPEQALAAALVSSGRDLLLCLSVVDQGLKRLPGVQRRQFGIDGQTQPGPQPASQRIGQMRVVDAEALDLIE